MAHSKILPKLNLIFFLFIIQINLQGQTIGIYTGERVYPSDLGSFQLFNFDSTHLYVFRDNGYEYHLQTYSRDSLKQLLSIKIPFPDRNSNIFHLEDLFIRNGYYQIFYSYFDKVNRQEKLDMINFNASGNKIGETKTIALSEGKKEKKAGRFFIIDNPLTNEITSYGSKYLKGSTSISINHFDYNGNKLSSESINHSIEPKDIVYFTTTESGEMIYVTKDYYSTLTPDWKIKIYFPQYNIHSDLILQKTIKQHLFLSDKFYSFIDSSGKCIFITPYSEKVSFKYYKGVYMVRVDIKNRAILREEFIPFEFANATNTEDYSLPSCIITNVLLMPENKWNIIFESRLLTYDDSKIYDIGNILSVTIDTNYQVSGICRINKMQRIENDNYFMLTGFNLLHKGNKCYFIYNELPENLSPKEGSSIKRMKYTNFHNTVISLLITENDKITERKILIEKNNPTAIDALITDGTLETDRYEMYSLRQINDENYLTKFYIKDE